MVSTSKALDNNRYVSKTCIERDNKSMNLMIAYCEKRFLFDLEALQKSVNVDLINITTGLVAPKDVNILDCEEIGETIIAGMTDFTPTNYKFSRTLTARQIPDKNCLTSAQKKRSPVLNSDLLYQRLSSFTTEAEKKEAFTYELSSYPAALFTVDGTMRESKKSKFALLLFETAGPTSIVKQIDIKGSVLVIDGGKLIHLVSYAWKKGCQFNSIINAYVSHVKQAMTAGSHKSCTVIFDGYTTSSTKDHAHQARYPIRAMEVQVTFEAVLDSRQDLFLSNPRN